MPNPECTLGLLANAAMAAYYSTDDLDPNAPQPAATQAKAEGYKVGNDLRAAGYQIAGSITPVLTETRASSLAALCLVPEESSDVDSSKKPPIVISFRGTAFENYNDVGSNVRLGTHGEVDQKFRDRAFHFYEEVRRKYPDREIVLTGHSLGGHLAQYVGARAYTTDGALQQNPTLQVRTFNPAPIDSKYSRILEDNDKIASNFINYRTSKDVVSSLPGQKYLGDTFSIPCKKEVGRLQSHLMSETQIALGDASLLKLPVGAGSKFSSEHNHLIELMKGFQESYACRVKGQFFSDSRQGSKNLKVMRIHFSEALTHLERKEDPQAYEKALSALDTLKYRIQGKVSNHMVDTLIEEIKTIQTNHVNAGKPPSESQFFGLYEDNPEQNFNQYKATLEKIKTEASQSAPPTEKATTEKESQPIQPK